MKNATIPTSIVVTSEQFNDLPAALETLGVPSAKQAPFIRLCAMVKTATSRKSVPAGLSCLVVYKTTADRSIAVKKTDSGDLLFIISTDGAAYALEHGFRPAAPGNEDVVATVTSGSWSKLIRPIVRQILADNFVDQDLPVVAKAAKKTRKPAAKKAPRKAPKAKKIEVITEDFDFDDEDIIEIEALDSSFDIGDFEDLDLEDPDPIY